MRSNAKALHHITFDVSGLDGTTEEVLLIGTLSNQQSFTVFLYLRNKKASLAK
jgi:hypothetical protein